jgi:hypothetical protein
MEADAWRTLSKRQLDPLQTQKLLEIARSLPLIPVQTSSWAKDSVRASFWMTKFLIQCRNSAQHVYLEKRTRSTW